MYTLQLLVKKCPLCSEAGTGTFQRVLPTEKKLFNDMF